jgi:hypothetical protein
MVLRFFLKKISSCDTQQVSSAYSSGITGKKSTQAFGKLNAHDVGVQLLPNGRN